MSDDTDDDERLRSRSDLARARKAGERELADLAKALVSLSAKQLAKLQLDEALSDELREARRMKSHAALSRQLRVVRRELRECDSEAIADALAVVLDPRRQPPPVADEATRWMDRFLVEGSDAIEEFLAAHEDADRQHLSRLSRNARKPDPKKAKKAKRALLAALRIHLG